MILEEEIPRRRHGPHHKGKHHTTPQEDLLAVEERSWSGCPLFVDGRRERISCEGLVPGQCMTSSFSSPRERERVQEQICRGAWKQCRWYRTMTEGLDRLRQEAWKKEIPEPVVLEAGRGEAVIWTTTGYEKRRG